MTQKIFIHSDGIVRYSHILQTYVLMAMDCTTLA